MTKNICLLTDSYKATHARQYPPGTSQVYSYFESRGGEFPETVFFGLQYYLKEYLKRRVTTTDVQEAAQVWKEHFGADLFNYGGWMHIAKDLGGRLPVSIKAVPEGTVVPTHNVLMTIENTDPECWWLTNWLETLLVQVWYGTTVATQSREIKKLIKGYLEKTGDPAGLNFKLHDFGFRGVSSPESAAVGGAAHLVNFLGTDTIVATELVRKYYRDDIAIRPPCPGFSIPASEHSTITSWGKGREVDAFRNMLDQYPTGLVACVSDSYDIFNACSNLWGKELKDRVMGREGTLVVRPDSGDPTKTVLEVLARLGEAFGTKTNEKGYKVLDPHVRVIQGDGVNRESIWEILQAMEDRKWSADNIAFGMGGALLQKLDRDTQKFAFKCSSVVVDGVQQDVWKDPVTDPGKQSKRGRLSLVQGAHGKFETQHGSGYGESDALVEVFRDGKILVNQGFTSVRERAAV